MGNDLKGIISSIGDHGEILADTINDKNKVIEAQEKTKQQNLLSALIDILPILTNGHSQISNALTVGLDRTNEAIQTSGNDGKTAIDVLNAALVSSLFGGHQQISNALENVHTKLADSLHDTNDVLESITSNIEKAGTDAKESLNNIGSKIESSNTLISTSIETALDFIDHVKEEIKTSGDASEQVISKIESKLSLLESPGINVKSLDANLKESLKSIASNIETQKQELIDRPPN